MTFSITGAVLATGLVAASLLSFTAVLRVIFGRVSGEQRAGETAALHQWSAHAITQTQAQNTAGGTDIELEVANTGSVAIGDYTKMDVLVDYRSEEGDQVTRRLSYAAGTPGDNEWTLSGLAPDEHHPQVWNPDETATLTLRIVPAAKSGDDGTVVVVTLQGASDRAVFSA